MHSNDIKDRFAELRAKGLSLSRIASGIRVSQRTLVEWNRQLAPDIRALRAVHLEASTNKPSPRAKPTSPALVSARASRIMLPFRHLPWLPKYASV